MAPTFLQLDFADALSWPMIPFVFIFLFMVLFDTLGTLVGVCEQAGLIKDNKLPRAKQAMKIITDYFRTQGYTKFKID